MPTNTLEQVLYRAHTVLMSDMEAISSSPIISTLELRRIHNRSIAILQEARQYDPKLHDKFSSEYEGKLAELRLKAREQAIETFQDISGMIRPNLNGMGIVSGSYLGQHDISDEVRRPTGLLEGGNVWEQQINPKLLERIKPLLGTYITAREIAEISKYSTSNVYIKTKAHDVTKQGDRYLIDEKSAVLFFGIKGKKTAQSIESETGGTWLDKEGLAARFGYSTATIYNRTREHGTKIPNRKNGRKKEYLITPQNAHFFKIARESNEKLDIPKPSGSTVTYREMLELAKPIYGSRTNDEVARLVETIEKLQVGDDKYSKKVLQGILSQTPR